MTTISTGGIAMTKATLKDYVSETCKYFDVTADDVYSQVNNYKITSARHVIWYFMRFRFDMRLKEISELFNNRHTSTIIAGTDKAKKLYAKDIEIIDNKIKKPF